ncbi:MAG: UDP-N-acetylglucosamine 2-epimerase [bacterium]
MRRIGVVTTSRADFGIFRPILKQITGHNELELHLIVSGTHLSPEFGLTYKNIEGEGFTIGDSIEMLLSSDSPEGIAKSMGLATIGYAQSFSRTRPSILLVLGDRFEMHAAALAALPFKIPVAHIHGGEITQGAIDESLRHSMTKLSHLHFVATEEYGQRVTQLGEEPWRITVCGAPSLDNLRKLKLLTRDEIGARFGLSVPEQFLLATFHPTTLEYEDAERQIAELLAALESSGLPVVFTLPNADTAGRGIRRAIQQYAEGGNAAQAVESLGTQGYFSLMALATAMVGNSSSGLIEAPAFGLPVVNVGNRQQGRSRARNVIDVDCSQKEIEAGIRQATRKEFRVGLAGLENPFGSGFAAEKIVSVLASVPLDSRLTMKKFHVPDLVKTRSDAREGYESGQE